MSKKELANRAEGEEGGRVREAGGGNGFTLSKIKVRSADARKRRRGKAADTEGPA